MQVRPINILLIEDSKEDAVIINEMLSENSENPFHLTHVPRLKTGFERLFRDNFDVLLLDLNLPDSWGFDTFIRTYDQAPNLPIVILSGFDDEEVAVRAVREGAQDYLIKGEIDGRILARSIFYAIERKNTERQLMKTQKDLRKLIEWHEEELKEKEIKLKSFNEKYEVLKEKLIKQEDLLKIEKSNLLTLINKLPVGILVVDASGEYLIKNQKLEEIWGDPMIVDDLAEYCYYNGSHPDGKPFEIEDWPLTRSIKEGEEVEDQKIVVSRDNGTESIIISSSVPILDKNGEIVRGLSLFYDATDSE